MLDEPNFEKADFEVGQMMSMDRSITDLVRQVARFNQVHWQYLERRTEERIAYPRLIPLTPLDEQGELVVGEPIHVVGKHLATLGLDFFHCEPFPHRYAVVTLQRGVDRWVHLLINITWCRFIRPGWYDSGGRFLRILSSLPETSLPPSLARRIVS